MERLDLANPLLGFFSALTVLLILSILGGTYPSFRSSMVIIAGLACYGIGIYLADIFFGKMPAWLEGAKASSHVFGALAMVMFGILTGFHTLTGVVPLHFTITGLVVLLALTLTFREVGMESAGKLLIPLGVALLTLSLVCWGIMPWLGQPISLREINLTTRCAPFLYLSLAFFILGTTVLMADGKDWMRIWGLATLSLGTLLFVWTGVWFIVVALWIAITVALRCFNAIDAKTLLIIASSLVALVPALWFLLPTLPFAWAGGLLSYVGLVMARTAHLVFVLNLITARCDFGTGTTWGGVLFGLPEGRPLMLQVIYERGGMEYRGGGVNCLLFGSSYMDFGILGVAISALFFGFVLSLGYKAVTLVKGNAKKLMVSIYSITYAFFLLSLWRDADFLMLLFFTTLLASSFYFLADAMYAFTLPRLGVEAIYLLHMLDKLGPLTYDVLREKDKVVVRTTQKFGLIKEEEGLIKMTDTGKLALDFARKRGYTRNW